jgi:Icc protein
MIVSMSKPRLLAPIIVALAGAFWTASMPSAQASRSLRGVVFEDLNRNQRRDLGEPGRAGVVVSDQHNVTSTDADGRWRIDGAADADVVFVSVPEDWAPIGAFWRPAAGASPESSIDFAIARQPLGTAFSFIHASDTHLSAASLSRIQALRAIVEREKPAFVLITGDLVRDALRVSEAEARSYYDLFVQELARFTVPVWTVPGNHENFGIERLQSKVSEEHPLYGKKMYRHYLGPNYYSFTRGGIRFVGLDTVDVSDMWYYGHVDEAQLAWLRSDLAAAPDRVPVVTFNHIPFVSGADAIAGYTEDPPAPTLIRIDGTPQYRHLVSNAADVLAALIPHRLEIALGGHLHTRESLVYETEAGARRFHQAAAVVGPNVSRWGAMASGVTLYKVRGGEIDDGLFVPLR